MNKIINFEKLGAFGILGIGIVGFIGLFGFLSFNNFDSIVTLRDLDRKWCEEKGGRLLEGSVFSTPNCVGLNN